MTSFYLLLFSVSLVVSLLIGGHLINLFKSLGIEQAIRTNGPAHHLVTKSKVPTMGGFIFLIPVFLITLLTYINKKDFQTLDLAIVLATTLLMAALGFTDDYLKALKKHNKGISGWSKILIQLLVSLAVVYLCKRDTGFAYLLVAFFVIAGASNSYNLTDGLDGLLGSISLISFLGFIILFLVRGQAELASFSIIFLGSLIGFLYFNKHPARIFMGDIGSLAIGGAIGSLAIVSRTELYLAFFATIPILEALSVILQVASCQLSKRFLGGDKRIFKMTPLHHHFELIGWKETVVVKRFFLFQLVCMLLGVILFLR